tara:strand:- start:458 stop:1252 length:795 start_codon:yes stop_codon:yes gene_type:complete
MKKVKLIEEIISKKQAEKDKLVEKRRKIELDKRVELTEAMEYFFPELLNDDTHLEVSDSYVYFKKKSEDYNYPKEILTLSMRGAGWRDDNIEKIETGFYSTTDNSIFELERMVLIGGVGRILLDYSDDIIANWNCVVLKYKDLLSNARKKVWDKEKEISELDRQVTELKKAALKDKMMSDGIEFTEGITLGARWNWDIRNVMGIKITRVTPSGKSYDLELKVKRSKWDDKKKDYVDKIESLEAKSVKAYNVDMAVNYNTEKIES